MSPSPYQTLGTRSDNFKEPQRSEGMLVTLWSAPHQVTYLQSEVKVNRAFAKYHIKDTRKAPSSKTLM